MLGFNHSDPEHHLSQRDSLLRAHFLAAEARDASISIHLRDAVTHGQGRYRTLIDARAASCTRLRVGLGPNNRSIVDKLLYGLVAKNGLPA